MAKEKIRCFGNDTNKKLLAEYHDKQWGIPVHNDKLLFEMLILEGAQAGLSWETVLKKRKAYDKAFFNFNVKKVAAMSDKDLNDLIKNSDIIRNRLKIYATRKNALVFLEIQKEFGSFDKYIWAFVDNDPIKNHRKSMSAMPATTKISDKISKDLRKRGMSFVGSTIVYAFMQAVGLVNDHIISCWKYKK